MQSFIKLFPLIYSIWGGILIVAGVLIALGFGKIMSYSKHHNGHICQSDKLNTVTVTAVTLLNFFSLFVRHDAASYVLDALILGHFWCTIYFSALTHTRLFNLPNLTKRI